MGKIRKKGKTALSFLLAMLMLSSIIPPGIITTAAFSSNGTKANPYLISTAEDLVDFRDKVNSGETSVCATLTQNIDLNTGIIFNFDGTYSGDTPNIWTPNGLFRSVRLYRFCCNSQQCWCRKFVFQWKQICRWYLWRKFGLYLKLL